MTIKYLSKNQSIYRIIWEYWHAGRPLADVTDVVNDHVHHIRDSEIEIYGEAMTKWFKDKHIRAVYARLNTEKKARGGSNG